MAYIKERIIEEINDYEWDNVEQVIATILPNIIFSVDEKESKQELLKSRFGGQPAVPKDFEWPLQQYEGNAPLAFFFQLNFQQIQHFDLEDKLPQNGMLLCFASVTGDVMWEYNIEDAFKIYYFPETDELTEATIPKNLPSEQKLAPRNITFTTSYQLPRYPNTNNIKTLTDDDRDGVEQVGNTLFDDAVTLQNQMEMVKGTGISLPTPKDDFHKAFSYNMLLGDPFSVQEVIALDWCDLYYGEDYNDFENSETHNYVNLISFEMQGRKGYGFSSNGAHLYLCMHQEDLKNKAFDKIITIIQNT